MAIKYILIFLSLIFLSNSNPISPSLNYKLKSPQNFDIIVSFNSGTSSIISNLKAQKFNSRPEKLNTIYYLLKSHAEKEQREIVSFLKEKSIDFQSFWVNNKISIRGADVDLIESLAKYDNVKEIREEIVFQMDSDIYLQEIDDKKEKSEFSPRVEWNIAQVEADKAWAISNGTGVIVCGTDTGVRVSHEALRNNFVGEYGWFDPIGHSSIPVDRNGHGTHTLGIAVGSMNIGVAPGSRWMACAGCDENFTCREPEILSCGQFIACPTDPNGQNPDCSKAPHITANSWGSFSPNWLDEVIDAWEAAGIIATFSVGNLGPACGTARYPGAHPYIIGTGAIDSSGRIADFSGKGPYQGQRLKPNIAAPGVNVRSAYHQFDNGYGLGSGTSQAQPHISGTVALLASLKPGIKADEVKDILYNRSTDRNLTVIGLNCGDIDDSSYPNNVYGYGRVNSFWAVQALQLEMEKSDQK